MLVLLAALLAAQPPADKKDPQSTFEPKGQPGAGQKLLAKMAGDWTVAKAFFPPAGGDPVRSKGTCRQEMTHGGRFLRSEFVFETADGGTSTGTGLIGFESASGKFTSVWVDSRQTRMSFRNSEVQFEGNQIVLFGAALDAPPTKGGRRSKTVTKLEADGQKLVHRQYTVAADGTERPIMELVMTRKPATAK